MSMIKCPECGKDISDKAIACPNCGCPQSEFYPDQTQERYEQEDDSVFQEEYFDCYKCGTSIPMSTSVCPVCKYNYGTWRSVAYGVPERLWCVKCGSENISVQFVQDSNGTEYRFENRKKDLLERTGDRLDRASKNAMTFGLYGLLKSKKSDYKTIGASRSKVNNVKVCVCQRCGYSWQA